MILKEYFSYLLFFKQSIHVNIYLCIWLCIYPYDNVWIYPYDNVCNFPYDNVCIYPYDNVCIYPSQHLSMHMIMYLSIHMINIYLSMWPSIYLSRMCWIKCSDGCNVERLITWNLCTARKMRQLSIEKPVCVHSLQVCTGSTSTFTWNL